MKPEKKKVELTEKERREAMGMLKARDLIGYIIDGFRRCGLIGEEENALIGYLASISRKQEDPLMLIIQSSSAAGKSLLMDLILSFIPEEDKVKYTAMTGQSLFYMGETDLVHKTLAISEEEGAEKATYAIKIMQSEKKLRIASTGKDPKSGRLVTHEYMVEGPIQIILTTTAVEIDEELQNRCLILTIDENREQTKAIHRLQREQETLKGMIARHQRENISNYIKTPKDY